MRHISRKSLLSLAVLAAFGSYNAPVLAQETASDEDVETIEIKGFRGSLIKGRDLKREAVGTQDSIVAEDIADFPDLNLAEALQRIPGVAITRDGGEGRRIALRGLDSNFSLVQLNGMDVLGNTDTAMDSRQQGSRDRAFDFNIFAAEMFNQIDVKKSYSASQDEGGMAGTVGLRTAKPFDYAGFNAAVSAQAGSNEYTDDISPRTALMLSNTWDNFGVLASVAYSERDTEEKGANTYRWRMRQDDEGGTDEDGNKLPGSIKGDGVSQDDFDAVTGGTVTTPRGNRYSVWQNTQERLGVTTSLQYRTDNFDLTADFLYGELNNDRNEYHINPRNNEGSQPYGRDVTINALSINENNELVYGEFANTVVNTESRKHDISTEFTQAVLNARWDATDDLTVRGLIGHESSNLDTSSFKFYTETRADFSMDYTQNRWYGQYAYAQDMTDASRWWFQEVDVSSRLTESENFTARVDFDYALNDTDVIKFGVSNKTLENAEVEDSISNILRGSSGNDYANDYVASLNQDIFFTLHDLDEVSWAVVDVDKVINNYSSVFTGYAGDEEAFNAEIAKFNDLVNGKIVLNLADSVNRIEETTLNAYVEYQWDREIGDVLFRGNLGLRYYDTDTDARLTDEIEIAGSYDGILPALNMVFEPIDDILLRASYSQNITRPSYGDLSGTPSVSVAGDDVEVSVSNPFLKPYTSDNWDVALEWYFEDVGYLALGYYRKELDDYIVSQAVTIPYSETGLPDSLLQGDVSADTLALVRRPENAESATLQGLEITLQREFDFLPAPFDNLGVAANYTFSDGSVNQYSSGSLLGEFDFPNLSNNTSNLTFYYETDVWGVRVSQSYRSDYVSAVGVGGSDEDLRGFHASEFYDLSAFYQVSDDLKVMLEGSNLTNERDEQYSDSADRAYNTTTSGRTFYLGFTYQF